MLTPVVIAAANPLQASRDAIYVTAGLAGVVGMTLLLIQPLLAARYLPGLHAIRARRWHRWIGTGIILAVAVHIGGLYLTSPADAMDALLLVSPTPFSVYGVTAMWGVVIIALLVAVRSRIGLGDASWRFVHNGLAVIVIVATVVHALMIEGTMGTLSKVVLSICVVTAATAVTLHLRVVNPIRRNRKR